MRVFHDITQNTDAWMDLRIGKITSSQYGLVMANDPYSFGDRAKNYCTKLALERELGRHVGDSSFTNEHTERGHQQEPIARLLYEERYFVEVTNGGFFDCGTHGTSPDGLVNDDGIIEVKSVIFNVHRDNMRRGTYDPAYKWQIAGHIEGTGRDWVDFVSYCADFPEETQLYVHRVMRNAIRPLIDRLCERREIFNARIEKEREYIRKGYPTCAT